MIGAEGYYGMMPMRLAIQEKEGLIMAQREYKQLSCRDAGADCDFMVRSEKEDEVMRLAGEHACGAHNICEITPELKDKIKASLKSVWCEGKCHDAPRREGILHWGYKF